MGLKVLAIVLTSGILTPIHAQQPATRAAPQRTLTVVGTHLFVPLVTEIARRFESANPSFRIAIKPDGAAKGLGEVRKGTADIAMVPRPLQEGESDLFAYPIARDGVAFVVETNTGNTYRTYKYGNPMLAECKEAKRMTEIADTLYQEFGLEEFSSR